MQHQTLLGECQIVAGQLNQIVGFADDRLVAAFLKRNDEVILFFRLQVILHCYVGNFLIRHTDPLRKSRFIVPHPVMICKNCNFTQVCRFFMIFCVFFGILGCQSAQIYYILWYCILFFTILRKIAMQNEEKIILKALFSFFRH